MTKVIPMVTEFGNSVKNQYTFHNHDCFYFQSYNDIVAKIDQAQIYIDLDVFKTMSVTTEKWLCMFLELDIEEIKSLVDTGEILLVSLN